jgi:pimeloyl-ACP methyl ester carboxylesterase
MIQDGPSLKVASRIPGCRRVIIPGADHMLPLRAPARLAQIIAGSAGVAGRDE